MLEFWTDVSRRIAAPGVRRALVGATIAYSSRRAHPAGVAVIRADTRGKSTLHLARRSPTHDARRAPIKADNLGAAEFALAYVQSEDYGARVPLDLLRARAGEMGRWFGRDSMERDFSSRLAYNRAVETYAFIDRGTRQAY